MADLTANRNLKNKVSGRTAEYIVKNTIAIYVGELVAIEAATGKAVKASDTAAATASFAGIARTSGTGDSAGTVTIVVERRGTFWLPHGGTPAQTDVGKVACAKDGGAVDIASQTTNDMVVGKIVNVDTANSLLEVDLEDRVA
jgi:hypothetical protein